MRPMMSSFATVLYTPTHLFALILLEWLCVVVVVVVVTVRHISTSQLFIHHHDYYSFSNDKCFYIQPNECVMSVLVRIIVFF